MRKKEGTEAAVSRAVADADAAAGLDDVGPVFVRKRRGGLEAVLSRGAAGGQWVLEVTGADGKVCATYLFDEETEGGEAVLTPDCPDGGMYPELYGDDGSPLPEWAWLDDIIDAAEALAQSLRERRGLNRKGGG